MIQLQKFLRVVPEFVSPGSKLISRKLCLATLGLLLSLPAAAHAATLGGATAERPGFSFPRGNVDLSSYDGPGFVGFAPFLAATDPALLSIGAFTGQAFGSTLEVTLLSEVACFDGHNPNFANDFGVLDSSGNFISLINTIAATPGFSNSIDQGANQEFTLALNSPEGLFSSIDADNPDGGVAHFLAMKVTDDTTVDVAPLTVADRGPLTFDLQKDDILVFIEDLLFSGNVPANGIPGDGDFDYNDMVIRIRQVAKPNQVPEPSTWALLLLALGGAAYKRRSLKEA